MLGRGPAREGRWLGSCSRIIKLREKTVYRTALAAAAASILASVAVATEKGKTADRYRPYLERHRRPQAIEFPEENRFTPERELLGRTLFFDPRLSGSNFISCATCHNPGFSWGDGLPTAIGHDMKPLGRRTPTVLNLAWAGALFWDGRSETLEDQCLGPIRSTAEMNQPLPELVEELVAVPEYHGLFERAYPGEGISEKTIAKAIATFERTIVSGASPFDRWVEGDESAVPEAAKRGFLLFNTKAACAECHSGWRFTDDSFYDIGVVGDDIGRAAQFPEIALMQHAFKTPTLRNVDRRYPYMHNGSEKTLEDTIELYDLGGRVKRPSLSPLIKTLGLTPEEKEDLAAFLRTLTSADEVAALPPMPR
jgi:cytochrome c peroxidase